MAELRAVPTEGHSRGAIAVLLAGSPFMAMMFAALGPILPLLANQFGGPTGGAFAAQMIMTVPAIGVIVGGLVAGFAVDRFGPRPVLLLGLLSYALAGSAGLYLDDLTILLATRVIVGLSVAHIATAIGVVVGGWYIGTARARFLGFQAGVAGVSALVFLLLSGFLAEKIGWRAPFALYLLALVVLAVAAIFIRARDVPPRIVEGRAPKGALLGLWQIYGLALVLFAGYFMTSIQLSLLLAADGVDSPISRSLVIAGGVLAGGLAGASYGPVVARVGGRWAQFLLTVLLGGGILLIGASNSLAMTALGAIISGGGGGMIAPHIESMLLGRALVSVRARAISLMFTTLYVADFLNPLIVTPLRGAIGLHAAFMAIGAALIALATVLAVRRGSPASNAV